MQGRDVTALFALRQLSSDNRLPPGASQEMARICSPSPQLALQALQLPYTSMLVLVTMLWMDKLVEAMGGAGLNSSSGGGGDGGGGGEGGGGDGGGGGGGNEPNPTADCTSAQQWIRIR